MNPVKYTLEIKVVWIKVVDKVCKADFTPVMIKGSIALPSKVFEVIVSI